MKNIIKYILIVVFAFVQIQTFALNNSYDLWKNVSLKEETNWLFISGKSVLKSNDNFDSFDFFQEEGTYFSISSEVIDGGCFSSNANQKKIRFSIKNISGSSITIVDGSEIQSAGRKLRFVETNLDMYSFSSVQGNVSMETNLGLQNGYLKARTFAVNETIIFDINYSSNITSTDVTGTLELRYGNATSSGPMNSPLETLTESNVVYKTPSAPGTLSKALNRLGYFTIATATGLTNIGKYKFYYNNSVVSPNTPIKMQGTQIAIATLDGNGNAVYNYSSSLALQYSVLNGTCESAKSPLTYTVYTGSTPAVPGTIISSTTKACYGSSVLISNENFGKDSSGTNMNIGSYYTWEISYDNGQSWIEAVDSSITSISGGTSLSFTNLTEKVSVRRKFKMAALDSSQDYSYSNIVSVSVINNEIYLPNDWSVYYVSTGDSFTIPTASTKYPSTVVLKNSNNQTVGYNYTAPNTTGEYTFTYTATATVGDETSGFSPFACVSTRTITIVVYDTASCDITKKRTFATIAKPWTSGLSGVANPNNAVNGNRAQYATITGGIVLLGIGTVGLDLYFTKPDGSLYTGAELKGKKVVVKLGEQYSGLKLAGGVTITGRLSNTGVTASTISLANASNVGSAFGVKGGVLDLLKGDNVFEFSFIPADGLSNGTPVNFNGIQIQLGSLLGVADLATVFYAFIEEDVTIDSINNPCNDLSNQIFVSPPTSLAYPATQKGYSISNSNFPLNPFVEDVFWGNYTEVLNVASGLSSVVYPYYAVDNNYNSFAIFNTTAGVLNKQFLNVKLRREARPGDKVQLVLGTESVNVLNLSLLNLVDYKVKFFRGETEVGSITLDRFKVLDLGLLGFTDTQKAIISAPVSGIFDRVQLEQWNTVNVNLGNQLHVYDIRVNPTSTFAGQTDTKTVTSLCATDFIKIQKSDFCTDYEVSFAEATFNTNLQLRDELGNPLLDLDGNPIYSISAVTDISNSSLGNPKQVKDNIAYYEVNRLFTEVGNRLLLKVQTKRNGCNYGDPQYLRVRLTNCESAIVNPVIKSGTNY